MFHYGNKQLRLADPNVSQKIKEQKEGARAMFRDRSKLLISDPGFGKTWTTCLALVRLHKHLRKGSKEGKIGRALIIVPPIALIQWGLWLDFTMRKAKLKGARIQVVKQGKEKIHKDTTHLVVSYGVLQRSNAPMLKSVYRWHYDVIICDEYEVMVNKDAAVTKHVMGILTPRAKWQWMLTGTPIPRYNDGLWPVLSTLFPWALKAVGVTAYSHFIKKFCRTKMVKYGNMRFGKEEVCGSINNKVLHNLLYGENQIAIRGKLKLKKGYTEQVYYLDVKISKDLSDKLDKFTEDLEVDEFGNIIDDKSGEKAAARRQLGVEKAKAVAQYLMHQIEQKRAAKDNRGILCLFWHRDVAAAIKAELDALGLRSDVIHGGTNPANKFNIAEDLNGGAIDVLIGQTASMGKAINLQENCNHVVFAEHEWSHARILQALQRVWRRGQKDYVQVDYLKSTHEFEDATYRVVAVKKQSASEVLDK